MRAQSPVVQSEGSKRLQSATRRMMFVPVVFISCRIWGTLRFIINAFDPDRHSAPYIVWVVALQVKVEFIKCVSNCFVYQIMFICCENEYVMVPSDSTVHFHVGLFLLLVKAGFSFFVSNLETMCNLAGP